MKKYLFIAILPMLFVLGACGGSSDSNTAAKSNDTAKVAEVQTPEPVDFNGKWTMTNEIEDVAFVAEITDNHIVVSWQNPEDPNDEETVLYWDGTFPVTNPSVINSQGDTDAMAASLLASTDSTKTFLYKNDELTYKFTMTGVTRVVHLKKD